jgi:hypothetical protein
MRVPVRPAALIAAARAEAFTEAPSHICAQHTRASRSALRTHWRAAFRVAAPASSSSNRLQQPPVHISFSSAAAVLHELKH